MVALAKLQPQPVARAGGFAQRTHIGQGLGAIDGGFTQAQQVQVRAIEDIDGFHGGGTPRFHPAGVFWASPPPSSGRGHRRGEGTASVPPPLTLVCRILLVKKKKSTTLV